MKTSNFAIFSRKRPSFSVRDGQVALAWDDDAGSFVAKTSSAELVISGTNEDGNQIINGKPSFRIRVAQNITQAEARAGYLKKLGGFTLPAAKAVAGTRWRVSGSYLESHASTTDAKAVTFGFCPVDAIDIGIGVGPIVGLGSNLLQVSMPSFSFEMEIVAAGASFVLSKVAGPAGAVFYNATVSTAGLMRAALVGSSLDELGTLGVETEIGLYVSALSGTNATTLDFLVDVLVEEIDA